LNVSCAFLCWPPPPSTLVLFQVPRFPWPVRPRGRPRGRRYPSHDFLVPPAIEVPHGIAAVAAVPSVTPVPVSLHGSVRSVVPVLVQFDSWLIVYTESSLALFIGAY
jgi:hypothetical protein